MKARLVELVDKAKKEYANDVTDHTETEYIVEGLLNEGVIVPPCKVGDKVWIKGSRFDCLQRKFVEFINEGYVKAIKISMKPMKITIEYPDVDDNRGRCKGADYAAQSIGKTVFLTREEAEQKLKERKEDEGK